MSAHHATHQELSTGTRAALYLRVSTGRQAEADLSIPDQRRQALAFCAARGWEVAIEFVEPGASGMDDRRPEFQRMLDMATTEAPPFNVVVVHSFSRFARDHFALEFQVRRLRKHGVRLVSITQDLGDDPMSVMVRQVFALFDEYQSKENAKHTLRAMQENARQGFWNGSKAPYGYAVVATEQRGSKNQEAPRHRSGRSRSRAADVQTLPRGRRHLRPDGRQGRDELA